MIGRPASKKIPCRECGARDMAICSVLDEDERDRLKSIAITTALGAGETVFLQGDDSNYLFTIVSGAIRLSKALPDGRRQITGFRFPGDFLGLSSAKFYAYSAETLDDTVLCRFEKSQFVGTVEQLPRLERKMVGILQNELAQAHDHLLILGRKTATERIASVLLKFAERIGRSENTGWFVDLPMDRADLADYLGLTMETVSRSISSLRRQGIISTTSPRSVYIPRSAELAQYSGDH